ncbi:MAG TPA: hypothetical protein VJ579_03235 [Candidatus Paceibacterota bacterium]|nr:hypothetical protein [Candidatus Paceibacterota bacterium]
MPFSILSTALRSWPFTASATIKRCPMDMKSESKGSRKLVLQEVRHGLLKPCDAMKPVKSMLSGETACELINDLFGQ